MEFLKWLYELPLSHMVRETTWGHPILLCLHALGMAVVVGVVVVLSIRVAFGWPRPLSIASFVGPLRLAWAGFGVNAVSGVILFVANAPSLALTWTFQLKLALIVAGGVSIWLLWRMTMGAPDKVAAQGVVTSGARVVAGLSILFWLTAIVTGRYIAYTLQTYYG